MPTSNPDQFPRAQAGAVHLSTVCEAMELKGGVMNKTPAHSLVERLEQRLNNPHINSWLRGDHELLREALTALREQAKPEDLGPHPHCLRCKGSGECSNAQFRCPCRWSTSPLRFDAERKRAKDAEARLATRVDPSEYTRQVERLNAINRERAEKAEADCARLRAERDDFKRALTGDHDCVLAEVKANLAAARQEIAKLRDYQQHKEGCPALTCMICERGRSLENEDCSYDKHQCHIFHGGVCSCGLISVEGLQNDG